MIYVFYGEDDYTVRSLSSAIESEYSEPSSAINVLCLDGAEAPWSAIVAACHVLPFLTTHQVVRVRGLIGASARRRSKSSDAPNKPGASPETLANLVKQLPDTTILIIEEANLTASNAHLKSIAAVGTEVRIRACPALLGTDRVRWAQQEVARRGGNIDQDAAEALARRLPGSLWSVSGAIDTLIAYVGFVDQIRSRDVEQLVPTDDDVNAFHLADAIAGRREARAVALVHLLLAGGMAEEQIMAILVGRIRDWSLVAALKSEKVQSADLAKRLGWNAGKLGMVERDVQKFARGALPRAYQALVAADEALKSRPADERPLILEVLVLALAGRLDADTMRGMFPIPLVS